MRNIININKGWLFSKEDSFLHKEQVDLPHCYNSLDGIDGDNSYYRGKAYYLKTFRNPLEGQGEELWAEFEGASMVCDVYLNDVHLCNHKGGYSLFRTELTPYLKDENRLLVVTDNSYSEEYYPQKADFTFYGGIYRDVNLITVSRTHFSLDHHGSSGIKVTPDLNGDHSVATVLVETWTNGKTVEITVGAQTQTAEVKDGKASAEFRIGNPHLWDGLRDPFLYEAYASVDGLDEVRTRFGIRSFRIDPEQGFILNGRKYRLIGVSKHQDRFDQGYAVSDADLEEDMALIREMGVNSLRLAHYQHSRHFYDLCDENGLLVWAEIPYITAHMPAGRDNTVSQLKELIVQNYNHPCIFCWGLSNEITTHGGVTKDLMENHRILNDLAHGLDRTRPTTMAHVFLLKTKEKLVRLPDVCAYNLYYGWYVGDFSQNDRFFDGYHKKYPKSCIGLSEFGADANVQYQTIHPSKGDYTEAYQCLYHEHMLKMWSERPYLWCYYVWNMFDFGADGRNEGGKAGQNQKGLVTFDRKTKKDTFYLYKAWFSEEPFVHICGKRYVMRTEDETVLKVYSNRKEVTLYVDGVPAETQTGDKVFEFRFPITGKHHIEVRSDGLTDAFDLEKTAEKVPDYESDTMKIHNWFDAEVKKGYFSLKDSAFRIKRNPQGRELLDRYYYPMIHGIAGKYGDVSSGVKIPGIAYRIAELVPLEKLFRLMGSMASLENVEGLAKGLPEIKK